MLAGAGARWTGGSLVFAAARRTRRGSTRRLRARPFVLDAARYAAARAASRATGARGSPRAPASTCPRRAVMDAERALLVQNLELSWRYSIGNPYEEFSFPESLDGAR